MARPQPQFIRCPSCQYGTLADGQFCAYCGRPLRGGGGPPPGMAPPRQMNTGNPGSTPNYYQGDRPQAAQVGGARQPLICPNCGAANDPWLTNCKTCQRPLMTTG